MDARDGDPRQRTGTADRQAAADALGVHARAGRISAQEYEERSETAKRAITWADLGQLFADLPAPHPVPAPAGAPGPQAGVQQAGLQQAEGQPADVQQAGVQRPAAGAPVRCGQGWHGGTGHVQAGGLVPARLGAWLMAAAPLTAVVLFFVFHQWLFFFLVPIVSMLVYGPRERRR